jgi:hypothetical protein
MAERGDRRYRYGAKIRQHRAKAIYATGLIMAGGVQYTFFTNIRSIYLYGWMQGPLSAPSHPAPDWEWEPAPIDNASLDGFLNK